MKAVNQNTHMTGVGGSPGGSSVPAAKIVYHERNGELLEINSMMDILYEVISSGMFQPKIKVEEYPDGCFVIEEFKLTIVSKLWLPKPGLSASEHIIYVQGGEK